MKCLQVHPLFLLRLSSPLPLCFFPCAPYCTHALPHHDAPKHPMKHTPAPVTRFPQLHCRPLYCLVARHCTLCAQPSFIISFSSSFISNLGLIPPVFFQLPRHLFTPTSDPVLHPGRSRPGDEEVGTDIPRGLQSRAAKARQKGRGFQGASTSVKYNEDQAGGAPGAPQRCEWPWGWQPCTMMAVRLAANRRRTANFFFGGGGRGQEGCELLAWTVFIMGLLLVLITYGCSRPGCCVRQLLFFHL